MDTIHPDNAAGDSSKAGLEAAGAAVLIILTAPAAGSAANETSGRAATEDAASEDSFESALSVDAAVTETPGSL